MTAIRTWIEKTVKPAWVAGALILLAGLTLFLRYPGKISSYEHGVPGDFAVYLKAWERVSTGHSPYVVADFSPYKYSPGVLGLVQLLPSDAKQAWFVFGTLTILALVFTLAAGARYSSWKSVLRLVAGLALSWKGILETLDYGQLELLLLAFATGAALLYRRRTFWCGLLLGMLPGFKLPWVIFFLPFFLLSLPVFSRAWQQTQGGTPKRFRKLVSGYFVGWFIWAAAVPSLMFGPERAKALSQEWVHLLRVQPADLYLSDINQSLLGIGLRLFHQESFWVLSFTIIVLGTVFFVLVSRLRRADFARGPFSWMTPWVLFTQLANPLAWRWGSVYAIGAPFSLRSIESSSRWKWIAIGIIAVLFLLQQTPVVRLLGFDHWTDLHHYGVVTAYWLALAVF